MNEIGQLFLGNSSGWIEALFLFGGIPIWVHRRYDLIKERLLVDSLEYSNDYLLTIKQFDYCIIARTFFPGKINCYAPQDSI